MFDVLMAVFGLDLDPQAASGLASLYFFRAINDYLSNEIQLFGGNLYRNTSGIVSIIAVSLMTLWVMWQGYKIATGMNREPAMVMVVNATRATLIVAIASGMAITASPLNTALGTDFPNLINQVVTGDTGNVGDKIDRGFSRMQLVMGSLDILNVPPGDTVAQSQKERAQWFTGFGIGGPALIGGLMLLLFRIAIAMFVGFAPIFILCLLFDYTKGLFQSWLLYGIGTMFSLAMLSAMVSISLDMVENVVKAFWLGSIVFGSPHGITSMALQQGGMGLILSTLIVTVPPMAALFFKGTLGQFTGYNAIGATAGSLPPGARGPGSPPVYGTGRGEGGYGYGGGYGGTSTRSVDVSAGGASPNTQIDPRMTARYTTSNTPADTGSTGLRGNAPRSDNT